MSALGKHKLSPPSKEKEDADHMYDARDFVQSLQSNKDLHVWAKQKGKSRLVCIDEDGYGKGTPYARIDKELNVYTPSGKKIITNLKAPLAYRHFLEASVSAQPISEEADKARRDMIEQSRLAEEKRQADEVELKAAVERQVNELHAAFERFEKTKLGRKTLEDGWGRDMALLAVRNGVYNFARQRKFEEDQRHETEQCKKAKFEQRAEKPIESDDE